eukprot:gene12153-12291_t
MDVIPLETFDQLSRGCQVQQLRFLAAAAHGSSERSRMILVLIK